MGDESEDVAPIIWLYQIVDAQKEEVFFPELLITVRSYVTIDTPYVEGVCMEVLVEICKHNIGTWLYIFKVNITMSSDEFKHYSQ